uniref:Uncharacterized protein n=1 Tax=Magnetococcus massalia (strain MO-1) TaxID=451514 RepID=A0A1S7LKB4_MAGMO|nr:protein of unknown function [Candidatus Magnetococcus massalia]
MRVERLSASDRERSSASHRFNRGAPTGRAWAVLIICKSVWAGPWSDGGHALNHHEGEWNETGFCFGYGICTAGLRTGL